MWLFQRIKIIHVIIKLDTDISSSTKQSLFSSFGNNGIFCMPVSNTYFLPANKQNNMMAGKIKDFRLNVFFNII